MDDFHKLVGSFEEGSVHSSGKFTISPRLALDKTAAFSLPRPSAWILKVVQAAVCAKSQSVAVEFCGSQVAVAFDPDETWTAEQIESGFFQVESSGSQSIDYLKQALWSSAVHGSRHFTLQLGNASRQLCWNGTDLQSSEVPTQARTTLRVALSAADLGQDYPRLCQDELRNSAYVCPIPLTLNGKRIDSLKGCRWHGSGKNTCPLLAAKIGLTTHSLKMPGATFGGFPAPDYPFSSLAADFTVNGKPDNSTGALLLLAAQVEVQVPSSLRLNSGETKLAFPACYSQLFWVLDGVIVSRVTLKLAYKGCVSVALFASAKGLKLDLTGLELVHDETALASQKNICKAVTPLIANAKARLREGWHLPEVDKTVKQMLLGGVAWGAFASLGTAPILSPFLALAGIVIAFADDGALTRCAKEHITDELSLLKACWPGNS